jgi:hypothetical protein
MILFLKKEIFLNFSIYFDGIPICELSGINLLTVVIWSQVFVLKSCDLDRYSPWLTVNTYSMDTNATSIISVS